MELNSYLHGKPALNYYAAHLEGKEASFQVHYWGIMPRHYDTIIHQHSFFEICYVTEGQGKYVDNNIEYELEKGMIFISRPHILHQIKSREGISLLYVGFELLWAESNEDWKNMMKEAEENASVLIKSSETVAVAALWKALLHQSIKTNEVFLGNILLHTAYSLILSLVQLAVPKRANYHTEAVLPKTSSHLHIAILHIKDNLSSSLRIADTAAHLHISERHLSRIFKTELGINYSDYVKNERIQKAVHLLKTTNLSLKDISTQAGFSTVHYFTRIFSTTVGSAPGTFRRLYTDSHTKSYTEKEK